MNTIITSIPDIKILQPKVFQDERGFFFECYNKKQLQEALGLDVAFVQDNHSRSYKNVLRGLHYQINHAQGKLVRVTAGAVFDVAVDLRKSSPTFGQSVGTVLSESSHELLWIPKGFAHGFLVLSEYADFLYKATDFYDQKSERCIRWDDPDLGIEWPLEVPPILSPKDSAGSLFAEAEFFP